MTENPLFNVRHKVISYYRQNALARFMQYESLNENPCFYALPFIQPAPGRVLDIGSGSGRDAAFFADRGYQVTAVEPAQELRQLAQEKHQYHQIEWVDDTLPDLITFSGMHDQFDHIHMSAVIFHLPKTETPAILRNVHRLLKEKGTMFISLRYGPTDPERPMFDLDKKWILRETKNLFDVVDEKFSEDDFKRSNVHWISLVLRKLPTLE